MAFHFRTSAGGFWLCCALAVRMAGFSQDATAADQQLMSCKPAAERTRPEGCWIVASKPLGTLAGGAVYWTLDVYPSKEGAMKANLNNGVVVQALDKIWLLSVGQPPALASDGKRIRQIGPLPVKVDENYTAQFMEGILEPGTVSRTHVHAGPEAFYTEAGETCLETPAGRQIGRNGADIVIAEGTPMELVVSGTQTRRGIVMVLHSSDKPPTTVIADWKSKGLCLDQPR
jgi:quercetin dioxygenase-like cupin family protein